MKDELRHILSQDTIINIIHYMIHTHNVPTEKAAILTGYWLSYDCYLPGKYPDGITEKDAMDAVDDFLDDIGWDPDMQDLKGGWEE